MLTSVRLDDKYAARARRVVMNGTQALLVAMMRQRRFDRQRGLNTAGFLSGYRGSPQSSLDTEAWQARRWLEAHEIRFQPGINEDLALTSVWGTQQTAMDPNATVEGVFGMWYGKGAGLDRCGDVLRHAHGAGSSRRGGVLVVSGDDHALKSSSQAYHSEPAFIDMQMPVLYPADIQEMLDFAILGWEMSRYSGCYVGFKVLAEHVNSTAAVEVGLERSQVVLPREPGPGNDRWIRWPDPWPQVERRLLGVKLPAALDFARANGLNRTIIKGARPRLGIVVAGKSHLDLLQAFAAIDLTLPEAADLGLSVYKIGMPWPADTEGLTAFCRGHETILVIEEKRDLLETQVRTALYGSDVPGPVVLGRRDRAGAPLFPMVGELDSGAILKALAPEIGSWLDPRRRALLDERLARWSHAPEAAVAPRAPYFCSGCPHNRSTKIPEGSRALGGVGCHFMATGMDRSTDTFTQMGGEGVPWIGTSPFTRTKHVFVNLGEGTYYHSGLLAIRAALAADVNVTYKVLFNDAIAMTGGQPVEGELSVPHIVRQLQAEGVKRIVVVADEISAYETAGLLPNGVPVRPRDELDEVQRDLRETSGVTVLIYDQVCATEKRRRRKRGRMAAAPRRILINERVCEGCGDCSVQSNCLSVVPVETEFGRKRQIDQANCNQDYSCVDGFCPSFVSVEGTPRKPAPKGIPEIAVPEPKLPALDDRATYDILVAGVGGTGIVTVGALIGMAAHLEGKAFSIHDKLGMAQKYGAVTSHVRIAAHPDAIDSVRIAAASARLMIGGDLRVSAEPPALGLINREAGRMVVASEQAVGGEFTRDPDHDFSAGLLERTLGTWVSAGPALVPARQLAGHYLGDEIGANLLLVGFAWQQGLIPLSRAAIERAIELNGVAVELNQTAFELGRRTAVAPDVICRPIRASEPASPDSMTWQELAAHRASYLTGYQNAAYAGRYQALVREVAEAESRACGEAGPLAHAVANNLARLMAYKDEYEVARLYTDGAFREVLTAAFEPGARLSFHFAPPVLGTSDGSAGRPRKRRFGPWILPLLRVLARLKILRGTPFDPFGHLADRREERALVRQYEDDIRALLSRLTADTLDPILALARLPERIRGYGHVKNANIEAARERRRMLLELVTDGEPGEGLREAAE